MKYLFVFDFFALRRLPIVEDSQGFMRPLTKDLFRNGVRQLGEVAMTVVGIRPPCELPQHEPKLVMPRRSRFRGLIFHQVHIDGCLHVFMCEIQVETSDCGGSDITPKVIIGRVNIFFAVTGFTDTHGASPEFELDSVFKDSVSRRRSDPTDRFGFGFHGVDDRHDPSRQTHDGFARVRPTFVNAGFHDAVNVFS